MLIVIFTAPVFAQPQYLISGKIENSGFGGISGSLTFRFGKF